jgi:hypothetical protein
MSKFRMLAYTGARIESPFWGPVVIDISGIKTKAKVPVLREHSRASIVGVVTKIFKDVSALYAEGKFSESTKDGAECRNLLSEGFPFEASIGVFASKVERLEKGEGALVNGKSFSGPGSIWRESQVREVSFVSLGADSATRVDQLAASAPVAEELRRELGDELTRDLNTPEVELAKRAAELAKKDGIDLRLATDRALADDPDLARRYYATFI